MWDLAKWSMGHGGRSPKAGDATGAFVAVVLTPNHGRPVTGSDWT